MLRLLARRKISKRQRRRLFLYWFIALVLIIALFANTVKLFSASFSFLNKPAGTKLTFEKFEGEKITGVILSNSLFLATFDPQNSEVSVFKLPTNLYFDLGERGFYLAAKVNQLEEDNVGINLLVASLQANFLIPVDFYLDFGQEDINEEKILAWRDKILEPGSLLWFFQIPPKSGKVLKTNFTLSDEFKLLWQLRKVRKDKFNIQEVSDANFEEVTLANGDKVVKVASDGATPSFVNNFSDLRIAEEGLTVGVYNAAGEKVGLAQNVAKICQNLGIHAVLGGDFDQTLEITKILVKREKLGSFTVKRLIKTFGASLEQQSDQYLEDIIVLVGSDLATKLTFEAK